MNIREDAIFIADSHYNPNRQELKLFLLQLQSNKIQTSQLFLMGDMFDFLSSQISYFKEQNQDIIELLNQLSYRIEIIYLEGNHDFSLSKLFPNILIIPREQQPLICNYDKEKVALAHGDIFTPFNYNLYTKIIRNIFFLKLLNIIDINSWLSKRVDNWLLEKKICSECDDFDEFSKKRIDFYKYYNVQIIIEGHFHHGNLKNNYINIPSLACGGQYFRIKNKIFENLN